MRRPMVEQVCGNCKGTFLARADYVKRGWGKYCSAECRNAVSVHIAAKARKTEEGWLARRQAKRKANPLKDNVRKKVHRAVKSGRVTKLPCQSCGATERIEAHHEDYTKPLEIIWLCRVCHTKADKALRESQKP